MLVLQPSECTVIAFSTGGRGRLYLIYHCGICICHVKDRKENGFALNRWGDEIGAILRARTSSRIVKIDPVEYAALVHETMRPEEIELEQIVRKSKSVLSMFPLDPSPIVKCLMCGDEEFGPWGIYKSETPGPFVGRMLCECCIDRLDDENRKLDCESHIGLN
jgi:hypothetical protein